MKLKGGEKKQKKSLWSKVAAACRPAGRHTAGKATRKKKSRAFSMRRMGRFRRGWGEQQRGKPGRRGAVTVWLAMLLFSPPAL